MCEEFSLVKLNKNNDAWICTNKMLKMWHELKLNIFFRGIKCIVLNWFELMQQIIKVS